MSTADGTSALLYYPRPSRFNHCTSRFNHYIHIMLGIQQMLLGLSYTGFHEMMGPTPTANLVKDT